MAIYTKTGDQGTTGTLSGKRWKKNHEYIMINGKIDEITSYLGFVKTIADQDTIEELTNLQKRLIEVMAYISSEGNRSLLLKHDIQFFEKRIDEMLELYPKQEKFILPGDCEVAARLDIARTIVRECERYMVAFVEHIDFDKQIIMYFNRMSDYIYTMARMLDFREKVKSNIDVLKVKENFPAVALDLYIARKLSNRIIKKAIEMRCNVVVSIVDMAGLPILTEKMDGAFPISFDLSRKKAYTSAMLKMSTQAVKELTKQGGDFEGLEDMVVEDIVSLGGGTPIIVDGEIIGAIGVSGGSAKEDGYLAEFGTKQYSLIVERAVK